MKIGIGYCYYNDVKSIKRGIPTFVNEVDYVFAVDGRFSMYEGVDYSDDGSTEYLEQFDNVIIDRFVGMEHDKRNRYVEMAVEEGIDVLIILDSDEYIVEADWPQFKYNLEKILSSTANIFGTCTYYNENSTCIYPKIWLRPNEIRYDKAHCIFNINGNRIRSPPNTKQVVGIKTKSDDSLRDKEWLDKTSEYQGRMIKYELPYRHALRDNTPFPE